MGVINSASRPAQSRPRRLIFDDGTGVLSQLQRTTHSKAVPRSC